MKTFRDWSNPARYLTVAIALLLLTIGLCGAGPQWDTPGSTLQNLCAWSGIVCFLCFVAFLLTAIGSAIIHLFNRRNR